MVLVLSEEIKKKKIDEFSTISTMSKEQPVQSTSKVSNDGGTCANFSVQQICAVDNICSTNYSDSSVEITSSDETSSSDHSDSNVETKSAENLIEFTDTESVEKVFNKSEFLAELRHWALQYDVNHKQLGGLLKIWNKSIPLQPLPVDARTILQTPRQVEVQNNYWHYGLRKALNVLNHVKTENLPEKISLRFIMDGLPISKSSAIEAWPILVDVAEIPSIRPCVVGIYCGPGIKAFSK